MASTYLQRTCSTTSSITNATISFWIKRNKLGSAQTVFAGNYTVNNNYSCRVRFTGSDELNFYNYDNATNCQYVTNRKFRDTSAWYHIVFELDQTQATAADRVKIYVNGVQETSFSTETTMSGDQWLLGKNSSYENVLGQVQSTDYLDANLAHFHYCEGYTYDASAFGQTNAASGIWTPKISPSVTYGTNGFFLKFANSGSLGTDSSGNANNFTVNGTGTQTLDTPSNVFATGNPLSSNATMANGNLSFSGYYNFKSSLAFSKGKWYAECKITNSNTYNPMIGIAQIGYSGVDNPAGSNYPGQFANSYSYQRDGTVYANGSTAQTGLTSVAQNDIVGIAIDLDSGTKNVKWYINGTLAATENISETASEPYVIMTYASSSQPGEGQWNFGNGYFGTTAVTSGNADGDGYGIFEYAPPTGYYALCTKNINTYG